MIKNCDKLKACLSKLDNKVQTCGGFLALIPRLFIGAIFIPAGWGKLNNLGQTTEFFKSLNVPMAEIQAPMVAGLELILGIFVLVGFFTRVSVLPLMVIMLVAIATAHAAEYTGLLSLITILPFNYLIILLTIFTMGAGKYSVDAKCGNCQ